MARRFVVLVASDGSPDARRAVSLALRMPWPADARAAGVVADEVPIGTGLGTLYRDVLTSAHQHEAHRLEAALAKRFDDPRAAVVGRPAVDAILAEARRCEADVTVVGSRGLGRIGRLALGSVSRKLVHATTTPVLVARGRARPVRRILVATDGTPGSVRAVRFVARLDPEAGARVRVMSVVRAVPVPGMGRAPAAVRADVRRHIASAEQERLAAARRYVDTGARWLGRRGWTVDGAVRGGAPLAELLTVAASWHADVIVCGARHTSGLDRLLLGSVAEGLLSRSPVPVLIVP